MRSDEDESKAFYGEAYWGMKCVEEQLLALIEAYSKEVEIQDIQPVIYTCSRIKNPQRMKEKLERKGFHQTNEDALTQVYDAIGVRAVCAFIEDVYLLAEWIRGCGEVEILEEKDYYAHPKPNGYRSYHMILRIRQENEIRFFAELQIRTIASDFWAALEHRLKYKKDIPHEKVIREELERCALEIVSVDASMQAIRDLLKKRID